MARKATSKAGSESPKRSKKAASKSRTPARAQTGRTNRGSSSDGMGAGDAFIKLLQSPLVADLVAVAATAALAALAEHGFSSRGGTSDRRRAGRAVKEAGKAAAAAIGRRLSTEVEEIRKASKGSKAGAGA